MILGLGVPELLVILAVALIIFGPKNLPKLGTALGKTVKNVREGMEEEDGDSAKQAPASGAARPAGAIAASTTTPMPGDASDAMAFCPHCGGKLPAGSEFCPHCGASLAAAEDAAPAEGVAPAEAAAAAGVASDHAA